jgi:hypothetical protein
MRMYGSRKDRIDTGRHSQAFTGAIVVDPPSCVRSRVLPGVIDAVVLRYKTYAAAVALNKCLGRCVWMSAGSGSIARVNHHPALVVLGASMAAT